MAQIHLEPTSPCQKLTARTILNSKNLVFFSYNYTSLDKRNKQESAEHVSFKQRVYNVTMHEQSKKTLIYKNL